MTLSAGAPVTFADPLGYSGTGTCVETTETPNAAVLVHVETITDRTDQHAVGRDVWILAPHVREA